MVPHRSPPENTKVGVDVDHAHRAPADPRLCGNRIQLGPQLVGRPEVVVVQEGEPSTTGSIHARVAGAGKAPTGGVLDDQDARVVHRGEELTGAVVRAVVHDDHFDLHVLLGERRSERSGKELGAVARRDDDGDGGVAHSWGGGFRRTARAATTSW